MFAAFAMFVDAIVVGMLLLACVPWPTSEGTVLVCVCWCVVKSASVSEIGPPSKSAMMNNNWYYEWRQVNIRCAGGQGLGECDSEDERLVWSQLQMSESESGKRERAARSKKAGWKRKRNEEDEDEDDSRMRG